jgi:hypothetical protein
MAVQELTHEDATATDTTWNRLVAWFDAKRSVLPTWAALFLLTGMLIYGELAYGSPLAQFFIQSVPNFRHTFP